MTLSCWLIKFDNLSGRQYRLCLSCALLLALTLRVVALISLRDSIYFHHLLFDERIYHNWAVQIMNGTWKSTSVYEFPPFPAYFFALLYSLFSPNTVVVRITNILFGTLTCLFIGLVGKEIGGKRTGFLSLLVAAAYTPLIFYSIVPLKTAMSLVLFSAFIWLFLKLLNNRSRWYVYLLTGIIMGMMMNVRPNYLVVFPPLFGFIIFTGCREKVELTKRAFNTALLGAGIALATLPFIVRNYIVAGEPALTVSQAGFNLYLGNNKGNDFPYYRPVSFASSSPFIQGIQFNIEASRRAGKKLSAQQASAFWMREVFQEAQQQPTAFARKILRKSLAFFNRFEAGDHYHIGFINRFVPFFAIPMLSFWMLLPLAMAGMAVGLWKDRKIAACASIFTLYAMSLVAFFVSTRYRLPMLVILIPLAVYGGERFRESLKQGAYRRTAAIMIVALFFTVVEFLPLKGTDDMTAYYNAHALILSSQGKRDKAITFWRISSQMNKPYSAFANLSLANVYNRMGDREKSASYLEKIPDTSFGAANKFELLGDISLKKGRMEKAVYYYRRSLDINGGNVMIRKKLIRLLMKNDRKAAFKETENLKYISSFYK